MMDYEPKPREWFIERIGKRIYRNDDGCGCVRCGDAIENGLVVMDETHADYLSMIDHDFACEGVHLNYRDEK
jgi:hypothetical protein